MFVILKLFSFIYIQFSTFTSLSLSICFRPFVGLFDGLETSSSKVQTYFYFFYDIQTHTTYGIDLIVFHWLCLWCINSISGLESKSESLRIFSKLFLCLLSIIMIVIVDVPYSVCSNAPSDSNWYWYWIDWSIKFDELNGNNNISSMFSTQKLCIARFLSLFFSFSFLFFLFFCFGFRCLLLLTQHFCFDLTNWESSFLEFLSFDFVLCSNRGI